MRRVTFPLLFYLQSLIISPKNALYGISKNINRFVFASFLLFHCIHVDATSTYDVILRKHIGIVFNNYNIFNFFLLTFRIGLS